MPNPSNHPPTHRRTQYGDAIWNVRSDLEATLLSSEAPNWFDLRDDARSTCVKRGHLRATWRVELDELSVFVKITKGRGLVDDLRARAGVSAAHFEWRVGLRSRQRNVPVVEPLALAVRGSSTVLITRAWDCEAALGRAWDDRVATHRGPTRRKVGAGLIRAIASHVASAHERGFAHGDSHPDNILVRFDGDSCADAVFVDLRSATVQTKPIALDESLRSIAQLDQSFHRRGTRTERWRFFQHYLANRAGLLPTSQRATAVRTLLTRYGQIVAAHARRLAKTRDRRLRKNGKYFATISIEQGWSITAALCLSRRHVFAERDVPDRTPAQWRDELQPLLATIGDQRAASGMLSGPDLAVEFWRHDSLVDRLRATLFSATGRRVFERCHRRRHRDLSSDLVLGYGSRRRRLLVDATVVVRPATKR